MTPDEARTKWCPFARVGLVITDTPGAQPTVNAVNRYVAATGAGKMEHSGVAQGAHCIADGCMAWRWGPKPHPAIQSNPPQQRSGYCGLTGSQERDAWG